MSGETFRGLAIAALLGASIFFVLFPGARRRVVAAVVAVSGLVAAAFCVLLAADVASANGLPSGPPPVVFLGAGLIFALGGLGIARVALRWRAPR